MSLLFHAINASLLGGMCTMNRHICFSFNNKIAKYVPVVIASYFENKNLPAEFHCLVSDDVTDVHKESIISTAHKYDGKASIYKVDDALFVDIFKQHVNRSGWAVPSYYYTLAHSILPDYVDKICYLDIDVVINGNINELLDVDISDYYVAVCDHQPKEFESYCNKESLYAAQAVRRSCFLNSGVFLLNLQKLRENNIGVQYYRDVIADYNNYCLEHQISKPRQVCDQSILQYCFWKDIKWLDCRDKFNASQRAINGAIIHYMAYPKPWHINVTANDVYHHSLATSAVGNLQLKSIPAFELWWDYAKFATNYDYIVSVQADWSAGYRTLRRIFSTRLGYGAINFEFATYRLLLLEKAFTQTNTSNVLLDFRGGEKHLEKQVIGVKRDYLKRSANHLMTTYESGIPTRTIDLLFACEMPLHTEGKYKFSYKLYVPNEICTYSAIEFTVLGSGSQYIIEKTTETHNCVDNDILFEIPSHHEGNNALSYTVLQLSAKSGRNQIKRIDIDYIRIEILS
jgi:lipopolysaccharide biosynthesis glycosyltransferase